MNGQAYNRSQSCLFQTKTNTAKPACAATENKTNQNVRAPSQVDFPAPNRWIALIDAKGA
jgi:hypothetical protein